MNNLNYYWIGKKQTSLNHIFDFDVNEEIKFINNKSENIEILDQSCEPILTQWVHRSIQSKWTLIERSAKI